MIALLACAPEVAAPPAPSPVEPPPPSTRDRAAEALDRAVAALDARTASADATLRLDLPIGLAGLLREREHAAARALLTRLVAVVDNGGDPRRRFWDPTARWPADVDYTWAPTPGKRVSPNFALVEAAYCTDHPLRPATAQWVCSDLRDDGGLISGHAAWILDVAVDQGCLRREDTCLDALRDELVAGSRREVDLSGTIARDTLGEQVLFGLLAGAPASELEGAVERLVALQGDDGSFGAPGDDTFPALHATMVGAWGLAVWLGPATPQ